MFVERFTARCEFLVEMQGLDLLPEAALDVVEAEIAGRGMSGLDNVEEVVVGRRVEERE